MDITEAVSISEMLDQQPNNGAGHIPMLKQPNESAYEAGLASGKEEGYQRGYREGFADGYKLGNPARGAAATPDTLQSASKKTAANREMRLRALPCTNCGCPTYNDEVQCQRCGTPKVAAVEEPRIKAAQDVT